MIAHAVFFYFFSFIAIVSAVMVTVARNSAPIIIKRHEILIKSKIKKKTEWTVFLATVTIIADTIAINEKK